MKSKYIDIAERVRTDIARSVYVDRLPSERQLAELFATTQVTVRKALDILARDGLLRKEPPLGTFIQRVARPRIKVSLLPGLFGPERIAAFQASFQRAFPSVDVEIQETFVDPARNNEFDLLRSAHVAPVGYADFASPYPADLIGRFDPARYFQAAFDVHRINGHTYGMPLLFSPVVIAGFREPLREAGLSLDPYELDLRTLLVLCDFARRKDMFLWNVHLVRAVFRAMVYSAGRGADSAEQVDFEELRPLLQQLRPTCLPEVVCPDPDVEMQRPIILRFCSRQAMYLFDPRRIALLAMPREIRHRTPVASESLLLNSRCPFPRIAAEVAAHFLSPEIQGILGHSRIGVPVLKSAAMDSIDSRAYRDDLFFNELQNVLPGTARDHDFLQRLYVFLDEVIQGERDYDGLIQAVEHEINAARKRAGGRQGWANEDYGLAGQRSLSVARTPRRVAATAV